ncbi:hypothetical protein FHW72_000867 [Ochrobactrum sp. RC6B]|nr:hypothetical protein [Ochrobactrum sp. RC6B]
MVFLENRIGMYFRAHPEKCETVFGMRVKTKN